MWSFPGLLIYEQWLILGLCAFPLQDEDFVADKDDEGSPTDDSGEGESDGSDIGDEEVNIWFF